MSLSDEEWEPPPDECRLLAGEVHIWRASLRQDSSVVAALLRTLETDERERASRFHFQIHREQFIVGRGVLREILSRYLGVGPERLLFIYNPYNKPSLAEGFGELRFNVSHSNEVALYALTLGREVGLDVEFIREDFPDMEQVAEHVFSQQEIATLKALPQELRNRAFFNCWTRKEAYIKALGEGLSHPLHQFTVSMKPGEPALLLSSETEPEMVKNWWLQDLPAGPGYAAALALQAEPGTVSLWQWNPPSRLPV